MDDEDDDADKKKTCQNANTNLVQHEIADTYFKELIAHQLKNISTTKKLQYNDIKRISKYVSGSIFDENKCCIWTGYITNSKNKNKGTYINFYFRQKKVALHRLLYVNFIGKLSEEEYLKFSCNNKGKCCNIHHMKKFKYNKIDKNNDDDSDDEIFIPKKNKMIMITNLVNIDDCNGLLVSFD